MADATEKRRPKTASEVQAAHLARLQAQPDKAVYIPSAPTTKELRAPKEMMKNVQGSSAGAGSGEFHVYKQARRREYERIRLMEEEDAQAKALREATEKRQAQEEVSQAKLDKNRAKRLKKKGKRSAKHVEEEPEAALESNKKQKVETEFKGSFKANVEAIADVQAMEQEETLEVQEIPRALESGIRIVDED